MNLVWLRAFHAVARDGSFTRAAERLGVTQPTLSAQVKALEDQYGVVLLDRHGRSVEPTGLGRTLMGMSQRLFVAAEEAEELMNRAGDLIEGEMRFGTDAPFHVAPLLAAFGQRHPKLALSVAIANGDDTLDALLRHRIDAGVIADVQDDPRLVAQPFGTSRLAAFVRRDHPWAARAGVHLKDFASETVITREYGSRTRRVFETALAAQGAKLTRRIEVETREAGKEVVAAGLGVGYIADLELGHDSRLVAVPILDGDVVIREYAVALADRAQLALTRAFFSVVSDLPVPGASPPGAEPAQP
jgi:aminoethylphosphonate catabolism LysR family transcriptional regulator